MIEKGVEISSYILSKEFLNPSGKIVTGIGLGITIIGISMIIASK